jgi:hypothetical protein
VTGWLVSSRYDVAIASAVVTTVYFSQRTQHGVGPQPPVSQARHRALARAI